VLDYVANICIAYSTILGLDVNLSISGFDGSTKVASLAEALGSLQLDVILPALKTNLLNTAALQSMSVPFYAKLRY
jgi:hypothetical protein